MPPLPITITQYKRSNIGNLAVSVFGLCVVAFIASNVLISAPSISFAIFFTVVFLALEVVVYANFFGQKIVLTDKEVVYSKPFSSAVRFAYKDVERIGYCSVHGRNARMGAGVSIILLHYKRNKMRWRQMRARRMINI